MRADAAYRRLLAKAWSTTAAAIPGWPGVRLTVPEPKAAVEVAWEQFPEGLRVDIEQYIASLTRPRRNRAGQRLRPLKSSTIRTRRAELMAAARTAVAIGVPIMTLTSLSALLDPAVVEKILEAYWDRNGDRPKTYTIELACRFLSIARETKCLDDAACERLDDLRQALEEYRSVGLTDKNIALIRQVLTAGVWARVLNLPQVMMEEARERLSSLQRPTCVGTVAAPGHIGFDLD